MRRGREVGASTDPCGTTILEWVLENNFLMNHKVYNIQIKNLMHLKNLGSTYNVISHSNSFTLSKIVVMDYRQLSRSHY